MTRSLLAGVAVMAVMAVMAASWSLPLQAQSRTYECVNETLSINITRQPLETALEALSQQTRCPVSVETDIAGLIGNPVRGRMTPHQALVALVENTGLTGEPVRQGLMVSEQTDHAMDDMGEGDQGAIDYDCQNDPVRVDVAQMDLEAAIDSLSRQTLCPVSVEMDIADLLSVPVSGTYAPVEALAIMVGGVGLGAASIRQGLEVLPAR
ncbi:MAG: hypothetical protein ACK41U_06400 [Paracoccus sp. (in: a-proteobacteria)]